MKNTRRFIAGMAAAVMALAFAGCGATGNEAETGAAPASASPVNRSAAVQVGEVSAVNENVNETVTKTENGIQAKVRALIEAAAAGDRAAYEKATDKAAYVSMMRDMNPDVSIEDLDADETWEWFIDDSYSGLAAALEGTAGGFDFTLEPVAQEEAQELLGYDISDEAITVYGVTVTKADGSELPVLCMVYTAADGKMFICLTLPEEAHSATESTANANAKTLYNLAAEVCYNRSEAKDPIPDGDYTYTVGEKYDDDFGKYINEVYGADNSFNGAVCEIKVENGEPVFALYTPAGQTELVGMYPLFDGSEDGEDMNVGLADAANSNAKTLYNLAAEVCYNHSKAKDSIPDGEYTYTVGEKYDDDFGKYINEVYGTEDSSKGAVCEIKVEKSDVVYALYTPAGQTELVGMYPVLEDGKDMNVGLADAANSNAKTLYNLAAEVCYNHSEAKDSIPDGEYSYTVGKKYDDDFGKYINEVYGADDPSKGAVCEIKVEKGDVVYALYTPAGQSDVTGAYPER